MAQGGFRGLFDPLGMLRHENFPPSKTGGAGLLGESLWLEPGSGRDGPSLLASSNGDVYVGFIGDLFNAAELCLVLSLPEGSDAATLILRCIAAWPDGWLQRLDGQFAVVVWQRNPARIEIARDVCGAYSVYYARDPAGRLAFSTRLPDLLGAAGIRPRLARRSLHEYLRFLDIAAPNTIYEGVLALDSGSRLTCTARGLQVEAAAMLEPEPPIGDFAQAVDRLDALMHESIERRLRGSSRAAAVLSGGVDSALICAIASRVAPGLQTITVGFGSGPADLSPVATRIAQHLHLENRILRFDREASVAAFESFSRNAEQPTADPASSPTLLAFQHCRGRHDTVLDGTGADALAGEMPPRHVRIALQYASLLPAPLRRVVRAGLGSLPVLSGYAPIFDFEHPAEMMIRWRGFTLRELPEFCGERADLEHTQFFRTFSQFPRSEHYRRFGALHAASPDDRLHQSARMTGLTVRYPFLESRVAGYLRQAPMKYLYAPGEPKRLLKHLLSRYVPRSVWDVPKQGFNFPLLDFLTADNCRIARRHLARERWLDRGVLDAEKIAALADRFAAGEHALAFKVLALAVLDLWLDSHEFAH